MSKRIIYIGADSAGYDLKEILKAKLEKEGYEVCDMGPDSSASCHYPIYASKVSEAVQKNPATVLYWPNRNPPRNTVSLPVSL